MRTILQQWIVGRRWHNRGLHGDCGVRVSETCGSELLTLASSVGTTSRTMLVTYTSEKKCSANNDCRYNPFSRVFNIKNIVLLDQSIFSSDKLLFSLDKRIRWYG